MTETTMRCPECGSDVEIHRGYPFESGRATVIACPKFASCSNPVIAIVPLDTDMTACREGWARKVEEWKGRNDG